MSVNENQNLTDQQELSRHLETLRLALEPLSDLSTLTHSSLLESLHTVVASGAAETPAVFRTEPKLAPATFVPPSVFTAANGEYQPALADPQLIEALLRSRLNGPTKPAAFETFSRQNPAAIEVELKPRDLPLKSSSAAPILRERPPRGHGTS